LSTSLPWIETAAFRGQVVLITGAGRGIGAALAEKFAQAGAAVVVNDIIRERAHEVADRLRASGLTASAVVADITRTDEVRALFEECRRLNGSLDVFVSSAGFAERRPLLEVDEPYWEQIQGIHLKGPFFCIQQAARQMIERGGGRILLLSSIGGHAAQMHLAAYSAAKGGVTLLTKAAALELAPHGITVNAVGPGAVEGPWNRPFFEDPEYKKIWLATAPMRRMATNDDIAAAVMFLTSREAAYITGQVLYVDGGKLAYVPGVDVLRPGLEQGGGTAGQIGAAAPGE
jgi:NAD(P)-dependent dehydrogenase (short-subunit alcohol dehydrogenase family)